MVFVNLLTSRQIPGEAAGQTATLDGLGFALGGVKVENSTLVAAQAERLNGSTRVTSIELLAVDALVRRLNDKVEGLGLNILGSGNAAKHERRDNGGELHFVGLKRKVLRIEKRIEECCDDEDIAQKWSADTSLIYPTVAQGPD